MPRKHKNEDNDDKAIHEKLVRVFRLTSQEDRLDIAIRWCTSFDVDEKFTINRDIEAIYFILAALIDVEHPLILSGRGLMYGFTACIVLILNVSLRRVPQPIPYSQKSVHIPCVQPVDNSEVVHR